MSKQIPDELTARFTKPILSTLVSVEMANGDIEEQEVELTLGDFTLDDVQVLATWAEVDPQTSKLFQESNLTTSLFKDPLILRNFLYAVVKPKLRGAVRKAFTPEDFSMALSDLKAISDVIAEADNL